MVLVDILIDITEAPEMKQIVVVAAVIKKGNRILIAQRSGNCPREPNKWEFPGGKVEVGEDPKESLKREIFEELSVDIDVGGIFEASSVCKKDHVVLLAYNASLSKAKSEPKATQCKEIRWIEKNELKKYDWAEADIPIVEKLMCG